MALVTTDFMDVDCVRHRVWWDTDTDKISCSCGREHSVGDRGLVYLGRCACDCGTTHEVYLLRDGKRYKSTGWY